MTQVTIVGNLVAAPELRFTAQGKAVASFTVAESERVRNQDGSWGEGDSTFWRCSIWDTAAENMAESLSKGQRVIVVGKAKQRSFETVCFVGVRDGEKRTVIEVTATDVGPSLKWAVAKLERTAAKPSGFNAKPRTGSGAVDDSDPWGSSAQNDTDEIPF